MCPYRTHEEQGLRNMGGDGKDNTKDNKSAGVRPADVCAQIPAASWMTLGVSFAAPSLFPSFHKHNHVHPTESS